MISQYCLDSEKAYHVDAEEYSCNEYGILYVKKYSSLKSNHAFFFDPPTNTSFGGGGLEPDPYEKKHLRLAKSIAPNSGNGVFARIELPKSTLIAHYSLHMYNMKNSQLNIYYSNCQNNKTRSDNERRECLKYHLPLRRYDVLISLPPEFDKEPLPNLGPKVNHHFQFNNSYYDEIEHPRWGVIQGVTTNKPIKAGEELFTFYEYKQEDFPADFPWYHKAKMKLIEEQKSKEKCNSETTSSQESRILSGWHPRYLRHL